MSDEENCSKLEGELGRSTLVLTIFNSKGMEFRDVFLYDFLNLSLYSHELNILEELLKPRHHTGKVSFIKFILAGIFELSVRFNYYVTVAYPRDMGQIR